MPPYFGVQIKPRFGVFEPRGPRRVRSGSSPHTRRDDHQVPRRCPKFLKCRGIVASKARVGVGHEQVVASSVMTDDEHVVGDRVDGRGSGDAQDHRPPGGDLPREVSGGPGEQMCLQASRPQTVAEIPGAQAECRRLPAGRAELERVGRMPPVPEQHGQHGLTAALRRRLPERRHGLEGGPSGLIGPHVGERHSTARGKAARQNEREREAAQCARPVDHRMRMSSTTPRTTSAAVVPMITVEPPVKSSIAAGAPCARCA